MKTDHSKKLRIHILLSILIVVIEIVLMTIKIAADSEPGAIDLFPSSAWERIPEAPPHIHHTGS